MLIGALDSLYNIIMLKFDPTNFINLISFYRLICI